MLPAADPDSVRIRQALADLIDQRGYQELTVAMVVDRAGVATEDFRRHFIDLDACLLELWRAAREAFIAGTSPAFVAGADWQEGLRGMAWATCRFMQEDHQRARTLMFQLETGGEQVRAERDQLIWQYVELLDLGRAGAADPDALSRDLAAGIVGSIWQRLHDLVWEDAFEQMPSYIPEMMYISVLPYLGQDAAEAELRRGPADIERYDPPDRHPPD